MIPACKSPAFERLFAVYNRHLLKRSFHRISVRTDPRIDPVRPTLYAANHSSWWDALLPLELNRSLLGQELYAMMSEEGLRRFRFFRRLGAFSVDRGSLQGVKDSLRYAAGVLEGERRALWLFPQGDIRHGDVRPLGFHSGIGYLLREVPGIQVVPVSFYYCFLQDQKPEVFADLGPPIPAERLPAAASRQQLTRTVEDAVTDRLDALRQGVIHGEAAGFTALLAGRSSTSDRFTRFFRRA